MSGCNCKGKGSKQMINNLNSPDHISHAQEVYERVISTKTIEEFNQYDKIEIMGSYATLYPASSQTPTLEDAINKIKEGIELYNVKYKRR
jgi:hypothetical protein